MATTYFDQVTDWMSRFTYKPCVTFTVFETSSSVLSPVAIRFDLDVPDATGKGELVFGGFHVPEGLSETGFWKWLRDTVIDYIESHEIDEWFKIDGKHYRPPHAPGVKIPWGGF